MASKITISTTLVGPEFDENNNTFRGIFSVSNGKLYLVPSSANKVVSLDPHTNEWNEIGDDLGDDRFKWHGGSLVDDGKIYCTPNYSNSILVIDPMMESTSLIPLPEGIHGLGKYRSSSPDRNGHIFFFPHFATNILKLQTSTNTISILDVECGDNWNHATLASNGHIYITQQIQHHIVDFDPTDESFSKIHIPKKVKSSNTYSKLVEHKDGHLYGISRAGTIKINIETNQATLFDHRHGEGYWNHWSDSIVGRDGCVYALSIADSSIVRFDPTEETTINIRTGYDGSNGWNKMCIGSDGNGYCAPFYATRILKIFVPRNRWLFLKLRLLVHERRATTNIEEDDGGLETVRKFIVGANDDEFSHVMEFV